MASTYAEACVYWDRGNIVRCLQLMTGVSSMDWNSKLTSYCDGEPPLIYLLKKNKLEKFKVLVKCPNVDLSCRDKNGDGLEKIARSQISSRYAYKFSFFEIFYSHCFKLMSIYYFILTLFVRGFPHY